MRCLVLYAHPVETSFCAVLHRTVVESLRTAGHAVDDCDLYAEGFDPVLSREERLAYHDPARNRLPVENHVERLLAAEALVLVFPVWNFGFPAILKGYFDRVFLPGVTFELVDGRGRPKMQQVRRIVAVTSYGSARWNAWLMGDPPRKLVRRHLRALAHPAAKVRYLALHRMNVATEAERKAFIDRVAAEMRGL